MDNGKAPQEKERTPWIEEKVLKKKKVVKMSIRRHFFKSNSQEGR